ncbi:hypothetical protein QRC92_000224 [Vibrio parahaemolyticus]|uniref:hypothetical protein n=1 Tax=Vibrio parahaemolyticus TaxID=670 RepID=UPI000412E0D3|nr:hypothetical protein [Vibrio parahaemolyticus]KIT29123.1 hypothetical protein H323_03200 [Vibrio parahaemolyticus VP766]EGR2769750.1 hypothetical protein [Vibrio parahaemolyticus]EGR2834058.1 hypothetical protein [Vibrio parahaemolyticus]EGR2886905.1 hypothetical protein [Vibrio parahaemolyticus]EGR2909376.1 hypothetical protein [Vibrio parahaemolyticus]
MRLKSYKGHGKGTSEFVAMKEQANFALKQNELLWEAYMVLDHGEHDERLAVLDKLVKHFELVEAPVQLTKLDS